MLPSRLMLLLVICGFAFPQSDPVIGAATRYRQTHEHEIVSEFVDLLAIPNLAGDPANLRRNAERIAVAFERRGVRTRLLEHESAPPAVFGDLPVPGAKRTVLFYAHYDGSPLNPRDWATPPFQPTLRSAPVEAGGQIIQMPPDTTPFNPEWRLYARSAGDDKAPIAALYTALDALKAQGRNPAVNVKFLFEGEEESGSAHLEQIIARNKDLLASDVWLICDGPVHQSGLQQIDFGARGIVTATLTVYGARVPLHSGHYGNWAPNPAMMLARLLASMKDGDGNVLIDRFYDGAEPLSPTERAALAEAPRSDDELKKELWLGRTEGSGLTLAELITRPALNVRGMSSGRTDNASNVIPSTASAAIDIRLVKGISHQTAIQRLRAHIRGQGYFIVDRPPTEAILTAHPRVLYFHQDAFAYDAVRTPMDLPVAQSVIAAVTRARRPVIKLPTMGGSLPLIMIERQLSTRTIVVPVANYDDNQHAANENIRLRNLWDGINIMAALLTMK